MKIKLFLLTACVSIFIIIMSGCFANDVRKENLIRPSFDYQKTYVMRQMPIEFGIIYNVWKNLPLDIIEYENYKELQKQKLFSVKQRLRFAGLNFLIENKTNNDSVILEQTFNDISSDRNDHYKISRDSKIIASVNQIYPEDFLQYEISFNSKTYVMQGDIKKFRNNAHSIIFNIKEENEIIGSIFKEYKYYSNNYEIIINEEKNVFDDTIFVSFAVLADQILRKNGYQYK